MDDDDCDVGGVLSVALLGCFLFDLGFGVAAAFADVDDFNPLVVVDESDLGFFLVVEVGVAVPPFRLVTALFTVDDNDFGVALVDFDEMVFLTGVVDFDFDFDPPRLVLTVVVVKSVGFLPLLPFLSLVDLALLVLSVDFLLLGVVV